MIKPLAQITDSARYDVVAAGAGAAGMAVALYAAMQSVMGGTYPGPGITHGPGITLLTEPCVMQ